VESRKLKSNIDTTGALDSFSRHTFFHAKRVSNSIPETYPILENYCDYY